MAKYFIYHPDIPAGVRQFYPEMIRPLLLAPAKSQQLDLFNPPTTLALPSPTLAPAATIGPQLLAVG
jgi:hypothetical protein